MNAHEVSPQSSPSVPKTQNPRPLWFSLFLKAALRALAFAVCAVVVVVVMSVWTDSWLFEDITGWTRAASYAIVLYLLWWSALTWYWLLSIATVCVSRMRH